MLKVYTIAISNKGKLNDCGRRNFLDITVKSGQGLGKMFAPKWDWVMGYKEGRYSEYDYTKFYREMLDKIPYPAWEPLLDRNLVVLGCYCKAGDFCHRVLLAKYLVERFGCEYKQEI